MMKWRTDRSVLPFSSRVASILPTAAAINLKRLAAAFDARFPASGLIRMREMLVSAVPARWTGRIRQMRAGFA